MSKGWGKLPYGSEWGDIAPAAILATISLTPKLKIDSISTINAFRLNLSSKVSISLESVEVLYPVTIGSITIEV